MTAIIKMQAPAGFTGSISCTGGVPPLSGATYTPDAQGETLVDPLDVPTLLRVGFTVLPGATQVVTALNTVGAGTITAAGIVGGITSRGGAQSAAAFTDTTATAALIIAALVNANIGDSFRWTYQNNTDAAATLAGGVGVTLSGITVVPKASQATFLVTYTAAGAVSIVGIGSGDITVPGTQAAVATADDGTTQTLTAAMISGANEVYHRTVGGTTPTLTMPLGSAMDTALPNMKIGQSYKLRVINTNSGTATVATNTGWTMTGTLTLATSTWRDFVVTKTAAATYTAVAVGTGTES